MRDPADISLHQTFQFSTMAKKETPANNKDAENALIQGVNEQNEPAGGNPGHIDAVAGAGSETNNASGNEADVMQAIQEPAAAAVIEPVVDIPLADNVPAAIPLPAIQEPAAAPSKPATVALPPIQREENPNPNQTPTFTGDKTDTSAEELHAARVKKYGPDYVVATRGGLQTVWSRQSWNLIRGTKGGWTESTPVPPEVLALKK